MLLSLKTFLVSLGHVEKVRVWSGGSDESGRSMGEWWYMGHVVKKKTGFYRLNNAHLFVSLKGILYQNIFYRQNLIFWIVVG